MNQDQELIKEAIFFLLRVNELSPIVGQIGRESLILANKLNELYPKLATKEEINDSP